MKPEDVYTFHPVTGHALVRQGDYLFKDTVTDQPLYINPIPTASAIIVRDNQVLLAERAVDPEAGKYDFPGGFMIPGETLETALRRELAEELGQAVELQRYFGSYPTTYDFGGITHHIIDVYFMVTLQTVQTPQAHDDVAAFVWIPLDEESIPWEKLRHPTDDILHDLLHQVSQGMV